MNKVKLLAFIFLLLLFSCNNKNESVKTEKQTEKNTNFEISAEKISSDNLPKEINFEGNLNKHNKTQDKTPERSDCKTVCPYFFSFKRVEKTFSTGILPKYRMFQEHYGHIPLICLVFSAM